MGKVIRQCCLALVILLGMAMMSGLLGCSDNRNDGYQETQTSQNQ